MKTTLLALSALLLTSCTYVSYHSDVASLRVADFHPTGNAISLEGMLEDKGNIKVNREQESSAEIVDTVANSLRPSILE